MILQDSIYAKKFISNDISGQKYSELYDVAVRIRNLKNEISQVISNDLDKYLDISIFDFVKEMRSTYSGIIPSSFDKQLYEDILVSHKNRFDAIKRRLQFEVISYVECEKYKRDTKEHKKGDFKRVKNTHTETPLSITLTYLARYGNENSVEYIKSRIEVETGKRLEYYQMMLDEINRFGFDRLYKLATTRRKRIFSIYSKKPIEYKSFTFRGRSRKVRILEYNSHYGSVINAFISLSGFSKKSFDIPVKFNKEYHGSIHDYEKLNPDYEYVITFDEKRKQVCVILTKKDERFIPEVGDNIIGIDVNVKHNMFTLSNGDTYDYDRDLLKEFTRLSIHTDKLKEKNKQYVIGKRKRNKLQRLSFKEKEIEKQIIADMCKRLQEQGINHIVMEDLNGAFGKSYIKDKINDVNYNRVTSFLKISSLKNEVEHIARKYGIAVSTVHASYTSKMCPVCGCIEDENRPNQETFKCIECGHQNNADVNAAINIKNRVVVTVLRDSLLKQLDNGAFEPKKLKREKVKDTLLSFRRKLQQTSSDAVSECTKSNVIIFDYV